MRHVIASLLLAACGSQVDVERSGGVPGPEMLDSPGGEPVPGTAAPPTAPEPAAMKDAASHAAPKAPPAPPAPTTKQAPEATPTPPLPKQPEPPLTPKPSTSAKVDSPAGRGIWDRHCAKCHGADGKGGTKLGQLLGIEDMTTAEWQGSHSNAGIKRMIRQGNRAIKMPAYGQDKFDDQGLAELIAYIRKLKR